MTQAEIIRECRDSFIDLGLYVTPETFFNATPDFHREIENVVLGNGYWEENPDTKSIEYIDKPRFNHKINIEAPRGYAKSSLIAAYAAVHHAMFYEGTAYVVILSKASREAKKRLKKIKTIFESKRFQQIFGVVWNEYTCPTWREDKIVTPTGVVFEAAGFSMQSRGLKEVDTRVTLCLLDDVQDENNTKTLEAMDDALESFLSLLPGLDKRGSQIIIIGTPLKAQDLVSTFLKAKGWTSKRFSACNEETQEVLWEEHETFEDLMEEKAEALSIHKISKWYSEKQCILTGREDQLFKEKDLRWWDGYLEVADNGSFLHITELNGELFIDDMGNKIERVIPVNTYIGVDPASSSARNACPSVTLPLAYDKDKNVYVLPYFQKRVDATDHADQLLSKIIEMKPNRVDVESVAYQDILRKLMQNRLAEKNLYQRGLNTKWTPRKGKTDRLEELGDFAKSHKLHLQRNMQTLVGELTLFPNGSFDLLDGLWYATRMMRVPYHDKAEYIEEEPEELKTSWMAA